MREGGQNPNSVAADDALEDEFAMAAALIRTRGEADITQAQVAKAMGTTQAVVARQGKCTARCLRFATAKHRACASVLSRSSAAAGHAVVRSTSATRTVPDGSALQP
jgi:hypothetical protein